MSIDASSCADMKHGEDFSSTDKTEAREVQDQSNEKQSSKLPDNKDIDDRIANVTFHCTSCDLREMVHYFGKQPPFVYGVEFCEDTYVMRDPFQPPIPSWKSKAEYFIAIGAHCINCNKVVCKDNECCFYFKCTYCLQCVRHFVLNFPLDVQQKLKKIL